MIHCRNLGQGGKMKTSMKRISTFIVTLIAGFALSILPAYSQDPGTAKGGGQKLIQAKPLSTTSEAQKLKGGDTIASACPKCKMISYTRLDRTAKGGNLGQSRDTGECPACDVKLSGDSTKHVCKMCGGEMICCVIPSASAEAAQAR
jgi:hypothetical protein